VSNVIHCFECNGLVASSLKECPHCHKEPRSAECVVCGKRMSLAQGVDFGGASILKPFSEGDKRQWLSHNTCKESWLKDIDSSYTIFRCSSCGSTIKRDLLGITPLCQKCGGIAAFENCQNCDHAIPSDYVKTIKRKDVWGRSNFKVHRECVSMAKARLRAAGNKICFF
jgi:hypothetical protein